MITFLQFLTEVKHLSRIPISSRDKSTDALEIIRWAHHPKHGIVYSPLGGKETHTKWFEKVGLPSSGKEFDKIHRGSVFIDHNRKEVRLHNYTSHEFTPSQVSFDVKKRYPKTKDYNFQTFKNNEI